MTKRPTVHVEFSQPLPPQPPPEPEAELACPSCGSHDIREVDRGIRTNRLVHVDPDTKTATFVVNETGEFEHESLVCTSCGTEVSLPEGWTIENQ